MAPLNARVTSPRPSRLPRFQAVRVGLTAAALVGVTTLALLVLQRLSPGLPAAPTHARTWHGQSLSRLAWTIGDTTEPGFAHSAIAGLLMVWAGLLAHMSFRADKRWTGFPVSSGTGLYVWAVGSAGLGLALSNLAWDWTIPTTGAWQPTFVPFASLPPAVVLLYGGRASVALTGAVLGAGLTTPAALAAVNFGCRPLGLPTVVGATTGMWVSALIGFTLCRHLPWMPPPRVPAPRCHNESRHYLAGTARPGPRWVARRMLADFTEAQFIGNEWAGAALLAGTLINYLVDPASASGAGNMLPRILIAQVLTAGMAIVMWHRQWSKYGWYPTFVPVVSVAPATVLAFGGSVQAVVTGAALGALAAPPLAAAIARRLPTHLHPFIGNVVSMSVLTAIIVAALSIVPGFCPTAASS